MFERVLLSVPLTAPWVQAGDPISPVHAMARIENRWQRLVDSSDEPLIGGVVLVGDSAMHTNPTFGRGVSLAFDQARQLASTFGSSRDAVTFTANFERWIAEQHSEWFTMQVAFDQALVARFRASLNGDPDTPNPTAQFLRAIIAATETDDIVARGMTSLFHLLQRPSEIFSESANESRATRRPSNKHNSKTTYQHAPSSRP